MFQVTAALVMATVLGLDPGPAPVTAPVTAPAQPEPADGSAPLAEPVTEPVAPEVAPAPVIGAVPPPQVAVEVVPPASLRPPEPQRDGRGFLIAAGVMGAINVGLAGARLGLQLGESTAEHEQTRLILTAVATPIDLAAGIGLAAAGGYRRGQRDAWRTTYEGQPKLQAKAFKYSGAILLVMGVVGWASAWTPWHGDPSLDARGSGTLLVESLGSLLLMSGSGLLAYGVSWERHAMKYARTLRVGVRPAMSPGFAGLAVHGRF